MQQPVVFVRCVPGACMAFKRCDIRFDLNYKGSGVVDTDFCWQYKDRFNAKFVIDNQVKVVHANEKKNQGGAYYAENNAYFFKKWGYLNT